jgi:hypothetical protein
MRSEREEVPVRTLIALMLAAVVLLIPGSGASQTPQLPPSAPVVFTGSRYYPSGPTVFFDGAVMVRVGTYEGVPLYVDPTRDPINVVYVPLSGKLMRPYARSKDEQAADLVVPPPQEAPDLAIATAEPVEPAELDIPERTPSVIGEAPRATPPRLAPWHEPPASRGVWIEFDGKMWTPTGRAPAASGGDSPLQVIGRYFDFPVYQDRGRRDRIYVPSTPGGPLIRYDLRRP